MAKLHFSYLSLSQEGSHVFDIRRVFHSLARLTPDGLTHVQHRIADGGLGSAAPSH
jgi:hypothetical protein